MTHAYFAADDEIMQENRTVGEWKKEYEEQCRAKNIEISDYAGYAYDAVWTYAFAFDKLIEEYPEALANLHSVTTTS